MSGAHRGAAGHPAITALKSVRFLLLLLGTWTLIAAALARQRGWRAAPGTLPR